MENTIVNTTIQSDTSDLNVTEKIEYVFYVEKIMKIKNIEERFIQLSEFDNKAFRLISFHLFK